MALVTSTAVYLKSQLTVRTTLIRDSTILNNKCIAPMGLKGQSSKIFILFFDIYR